MRKNEMKWEELRWNKKNSDKMKWNVISEMQIRNKKYKIYNIIFYNLWNNLLLLYKIYMYGSGSRISHVNFIDKKDLII